MEKTLYIDGIATPYSVSDEGFVRKTKTNRIIKTHLSKNGDVQLELTLDEKRCRKTLSHLVAGSYLTRPQNCKNVIHLDGNKLNNKVSNLAWVDTKTNFELTKENNRVFTLHYSNIVSNDPTELALFKARLDKYADRKIDFATERQIEVDCDIQLATAASLLNYTGIKKLAAEKFGIKFEEV